MTPTHPPTGHTAAPGAARCNSFYWHSMAVPPPTHGCSLPRPEARLQQECVLEGTPAGSRVLTGQDTSPQKLLLLRKTGQSLRKVRTVSDIGTEKAQKCQGSLLLSWDPLSPRMNNQAGPVESRSQSRERDIAELQLQKLQPALREQPGCAGGYNHSQLLHPAQPSIPCTVSSSQ